MKVIETNSNCFDVKHAPVTEGIAEDEICIEATNHALETIIMIVKKDQLKKLIGE